MEAEHSKKMGGEFWSIPPLLLRIILLVLLVVGLGIRLLDLTDPPLDFNPTRQLRAAVIARGIYYQLSPSMEAEARDLAISLWNTTGELEPPILEALVGLTYKLVGGEHLWISRIYTSLFWVLGGLALYALARRTTSAGGALAALGFYLFLPFSVYASRSFQPDPVMVVCIVLSMYAAHHWAEERSWKWALLTGVSGALAILFKVVAAFLIGGMMIALVVRVLSLRRGLLDKQVWAMVAAMLAPAVVYYVFLRSDYASGYFANWVIALSPLLLDPATYVRWLIRLDSLVDLSLLFAALAGLFISRGANRTLLLGLWVGYVVYGMALPHQTTTHDYYHIQLIPVAALSLAPLAELLLARVVRQEVVWRVLFVGLVLLSLFYPLWITRSTLLGVDYRQDPPFWAQVGEAIPRNGKTIALTQQYGHLIAYYGWKKVNLWPVAAEKQLAELRGAQEKEIEAFFAERAGGADFFLVTAFSQFSRQPNLEALLYSTFPVYAEGNGYIIFDLRESQE